MIVILRRDATAEQRLHLMGWLESQGLDVNISEGSENTVLGLVGDTSCIDTELLESLAIVESVRRLSEPFKKVNRKFRPGQRY